MYAFVNGFTGALIAAVLCLAMFMFFAAVEKIDQLEYDLSACEALSAEVNK